MPGSHTSLATALNTNTLTPHKPRHRCITWHDITLHYLIHSHIPQERAMELKKKRQLTFTDCCEHKVNVPHPKNRFKLLHAYSNIPHFRHKNTSVLGFNGCDFQVSLQLNWTFNDYTRIRAWIAVSNWSHMHQTIRQNSNRRAGESASVAQLSVHWDGYQTVGGGERRGRGYGCVWPSES